MATKKHQESWIDRHSFVLNEFRRRRRHNNFITKCEGASDRVKDQVDDQFLT